MKFKFGERYEYNGGAVRNLHSSNHLKTQSSFYNRLKQAAIIRAGIASEKLLKNICVTWDKSNRLRIASFIDIENPAVGVAFTNIERGATNSIITAGYIHDPELFNWTHPPNTSLFVGKNGRLTPIPPNRFSIQKMGYIVDVHTVYIKVGPQILIEESAVDEIPTTIINYINPGWINNINGIN